VLVKLAPVNMAVWKNYFSDLGGERSHQESVSNSLVSNWLWMELPGNLGDTNTA